MCEEKYIKINCNDVYANRGMIILGPKMPMPSTVTIRCNRNKMWIKTKGHVSRTHETYCGSPVTDNQAPPLGAYFWERHIKKPQTPEEM